MRKQTLIALAATALVLAVFSGVLAFVSLEIGASLLAGTLAALVLVYGAGAVFCLLTLAGRCRGRGVYALASFLGFCSALPLSLAFGFTDNPGLVAAAAFLGAFMPVASRAWGFYVHCVQSTTVARRNVSGN